MVFGVKILLQGLRGSNSQRGGHTDHGERPDRRQWREKGGKRVAAVGEGRRRIAEDIRRAPQQEERSDSNPQPACRLLQYNHMVGIKSDLCQSRGHNCLERRNYFRDSSTATATETVMPTMGLLPAPRKPIISTSNPTFGGVCIGTQRLFQQETQYFTKQEAHRLKA